MLTLRGIITLLVLAVLFALAVVWISKNGGGEGGGGGLWQLCVLPQPLRKPGAQKAVTLKAPPVCSDICPHSGQPEWGHFHEIEMRAQKEMH